MTEASARRSAGESVLGALRERPEDQDLWDRLRVRQFPGARINLDPGSIATPAQAVRAAMQGFWDDELFAYPEGQVQRGRAERRRARALAAALWGGDPPALTAGTSEALRTIGHALRERLGGGEAPLVLTSEHEHPSATAAFEAGFRAATLPDSALRDPAAAGAIAAVQRPAIVLLSQVTCTIGQVVPVREIAAAVRAAAPEVFVIVDAAQALGLVPPALPGADFVVASGHKWLFGPPGTGFAWTSPRARAELPLLAPGGEESGAAGLERRGTHDFSIYAGLAAALDLHAALGHVALKRSRTLAAWSARELHERLVAAGVAHRFFDPITGEEREAPPTAEQLLATVSVALPGVDVEAVCTALHRAGIHLRCVVDRRAGKRTPLLRLGAPCYESTARVRRAIEALATAVVASRT
ncbi:Selenocysteine lyase/Cysteine desulfurase [Nannocystis exedens]|uniref:Selenocysteine lyase/Cysteine desulfurase n=1 Tax=Nannocystis exedens TaxID=54 RepID=A0A1I2GAK7_9BACT|nr:aminotransferase class V-fold PLP-dependent enzyme [Nannocystis exedens]PCC67383.1 Isopenicillin N epimerase [Nannocystis exedens]SFF14218.1 Selenocysteine lyase/Cysteine desulfurase [Nannocystis exedens]